MYYVPSSRLSLVADSTSASETFCPVAIRPVARSASTASATSDGVHAD